MTKSQEPFCALGTDHALEQENRKMKFLGGIFVIANRKSTLKILFSFHFYLAIYQSSSAIILGFYKTIGEFIISLRSSVNSRYYKNTEKLNALFVDHNVDFSLITDVYNVITKKLLPKDHADIFLAHGSELLNLFRIEHLYGEKSISNPMVKRKYQHLQKQRKR